MSDARQHQADFATRLGTLKTQLTFCKLDGAWMSSLANHARSILVIYRQMLFNVENVCTWTSPVTVPKSSGCPPKCGPLLKVVGNTTATPSNTCGE